MRQGGCILAVDDNPNNLEILVELLSSSYELTTATSGEEALRLAPQLRPSLILLDVMMPGIDGFETCKRLRAIPELKDVKIVMLSARQDIKDRLSAYLQGALDYVTKPFDPREVLAKVRAWMQMAYQRQVEDLRADAERAKETIGFAMVTLTGVRDTETGEHLFRMRWYTQAIAEQLSVSGPYAHLMNEAFLDQLYRASPLHDLGKIAVDDAILRKGSGLDEAERAAMMQHTVLGGDILDKATHRLPEAPYLRMAAAIARHHHEHFDGSGYPDGLQGEAIPLAARIVAVADVVDALTSPRHYRKAWTVDEALAYVRARSGTQFDPVVVAACREVEDDIKRAAEHFLSLGESEDGPQRTMAPCDSSIDHVEFAPDAAKCGALSP
jgi:putative two-component system response regulator